MTDLKIVFFCLDLIYLLLLCYFLGSMKLLCAHFFVLAMILTSKPDIALLCVLWMRTVAFSAIYGMENCELYLILSILYLEMLLSRSIETKTSHRLLAFSFLLIMIACEFAPLSCTVDSLSLSYINLLTRLYVLTYLTIRVVHEKYALTKNEKQLYEEAKILANLERDELDFMKRFSIFSLNSLNGIVNCLSFLRRSDNTSPEKEESSTDMELTKYFNTIETSSSQVTSQTTDLVEYYMIRSGAYLKHKSKVEVIDLKCLVEYIVRIQKKLRLDFDAEKRVKVLVELDKSVPLEIIEDKSLLSKIFTNIISNAIKYTDHGSVDISLLSQPLPQEEDNKVMLTLQVVDTGIGIKKELQDRLFEAFVRNHSDKDSFSIGLVITKGIIDRLGGSITITSKGEGHGTKCLVNIPVLIPAPKKKKRKRSLKDDPDNIATITPIITQNLEYRTDITDVLIVEDNLINRKVVEKQVTDIMGHPNLEIHKAPNGEVGLEILERIHARNPLVLTDIDMPVMNGKEFCRHVRSSEEERYGGKRLVMYSLTATIIPNGEDFSASFGDGVTTKPVYFNEMKSILQLMIEKRKRRILHHQEQKQEQQEQEQQEKEHFHQKKRRKSIMISIDNKGDEKERYKNDLILTFFSFLATTMMLYGLPEEYYEGWVNHCFRLFVFSMLQYATSYLLGLSAEKNSILSLLRMFVLSALASETTFIVRLKMVYLCHFTYIIQASDTLHSFCSCCVFSVLYYLMLCYYELIRPPHITILGQHEKNQRYLNMGNWVVYVFFLSHVIVISNQAIHHAFERKKRWGVLIDKKKKIKRDYNLTLSKISHDLATPVSALVIYLEEMKELLEKKIFSSYNITTRATTTTNKYEFKKYFEMMMQCSLELELSLHNFLVCCKIKNDMIVPVISRNVQIQKFIEDIIDKCSKIQQEQEQQRVKLDVRFDECFRNELYSIDLSNTRLILMNLIMNTFLHSKAEHIRISCSLILNDIIQPQPLTSHHHHHTENKKKILFRVEDDGVGIREEILQSIFHSEKEEFHFQERSKLTLGLGLVVCKYLSDEMNNSQINVFSSSSSNNNNNNNEKGTRIEFLFPSYDVKKKTNPKEEKRRKSMDNKLMMMMMMEGEEEPKNNNLASATATTTLHVQLKGHKLRAKEMNVLCMDDSSFLVTFMRMYMIKFGFPVVETVVREEDFLAKIQRKQYDVLVTDYNLKRMNCVQLLSLAQKQKQLLQRRRRRRRNEDEEEEEEDIFKVVICITGSPEGIKDVDGLIDGIVPKPIVMLNLKNTLERFIEIE